MRDQEMADQLTLLCGVTPLVMPFNHASPEKTINPAIEFMKQAGYIKKGNTVVVVSSISAEERIVEAIQMRVVE